MRSLGKTRQSGQFALPASQAQFVVPPLGRKRLASRNGSASDACGLKAGLRTAFTRRTQVMLRIKNRLIICLLGAALLAPSFSVHAQTPYQKPPKAVLDVLDAPDSAVVSVSPSRDKMLLATPVRYPSIAELAEPMLRLAGSRINPKTNGPHNPRRIVKLTLKNIADGKETAIALPLNANLGMPEWSNDGKQFAVTNTTSNSAGGAIELWIGDAATGKLRRIPGVRLNAAFSGGGFGGGRGGAGRDDDTVQWL